MKRGDILRVAIIGAAVGLLIQLVLQNTSLASHLTIGIRVGIFVAFLVLAPLALFIASLIEKFWHGIYQFAQFAAVGVLNSFIDVGIFNLETFLYGSSAISNTLFAVFKAISFLFATTNSFVWNKYWTFADPEKSGAGKVTSFYGIALVGWGINVAFATFIKSIGPTGTTGLATAWVNIISPVAGILISFVWNFIGYKYFVFKKRA